MMKTPSHSRSEKKNPSLLNVFKKVGNDAETTDTAPNTPEEETGVTVVANEIDPTQELIPHPAFQHMPSPLRGDHASNSTKSSAVREEKKEDQSVPGDETVEDVVSKTLNFFDDMCAIPQKPQIGSDCDVENITASSIKKHPHLSTLDNSYAGAAAYDDNTSSPSLPSETTGNSSGDPSTRYSNSYVSSYNNNSKNNLSEKADRTQTTAHDHENFEVVLDPASMTKEEKTKSVKQHRGKRWNRISKSLTLSSPSTKKDKNQIANGPNKTYDSTDFPEGESKKSPSADSEALMAPTEMEADDAPLDEEVGHLTGITEHEQHESGKNAPVYNNNKELKSPTSVAGPKVLAKKIWKNCKKIPIPVRQKVNQTQQSHRAEVDSEAAVARSLEANRSLEEQEFLQLGCPKQDVEPILEVNESEDDADHNSSNELNLKDTEQRSSMAKAWNNIFASVTNTSDPEISAETSPTGSNAKLPTSDRSKVPTLDNVGAFESPSIMDKQQQSVPEGHSIEVSPSHANKKLTQSRTASLGRRLKKIQKSAYFKSNKKGSKNSKVSNSSKRANEVNSNFVEHSTSVANLGSVATEKRTTPATDLSKKPKMIWKAVVDPNSGKTYYYHRKTRETTWTKPDAFERYEVAHKRWLDAIAGMQSSNATARVEMKKEETKVEESAPTSSTVSSNEVEKNGKTNAADTLRASTPPAEKNKTNPQSVSPIKEAKEQDPTTDKKIIPGESSQKSEEKETIQPTEKIKQPFDESKPFDESTPFDEPLTDKGPGLLFLPRSPARFGRTMTYTSKASARSALTDRTEKIRNTGKGKFSSINPINENISTATSISSFHDTERHDLGRGRLSANRVPSRVPVHRERQLMVEELTDARLSAESYEGNAGEKRGRIVRGRAREVEPTPEVLYDGDNDTFEDYGTSTFDNETYGTDSVSALSENDTDFLSRRDNFDQARRRALDAAIEIEDWDLAAALSDGMRAVNLPGGYEKAHSSWNQSELDKFIANNDWSAVKSYIARMREQSKKEQGNRASSRKGQASSANKRVGSRSQIQHREMMSESSWSVSDSSSYETYDSESEI